jgi:hypothetical protein
MAKINKNGAPAYDRILNIILVLRYSENGFWQKYKEKPKSVN